MTFGEQLAEQFDLGRHLCVGIDPHPEILAAWNLPDEPAALEQLGIEVVNAAAGRAACVKPQVACFERHGAQGFAALERVLNEARALGVLTIADVKRGDIGSSFAAYASAWLRPGSPLESDAMTVVAYQGVGTLRDALPHVREDGKGLFVLAATSNPEAAETQQAQRASGESVAAGVVREVREWNMSLDKTRVGSLGVVLGATLDLARFGIDTAQEAQGPALPVLAPGFGHQGARLDAAPEIFGTLSGAVLANESRSILGGGSNELELRIAERQAAAEALGSTE